jgi:hypothetical protein
MNKEENLFDDFLKERLDHHTVEVSPSVWEKISEKQKKRTKLLWFRNYLNLFLALDMLLIGSLTSVILMNSYTVKSQQRVAFQQNESDLKSFSNQDQKTKQATNTSGIYTAESPSEVMETNVAENADIIKVSEHKTNLAASKSPTDSPLLEGPSDKVASSHNKVSVKKSATVNETKLQQQVIHHQQVYAKNISTTANQDTERPLAYCPPQVMMPLLAMHPVSNSESSNYNILNSHAEVIEIRPSVMFSKPKKLVRQEQKLQEKAEQSATQKQAENNAQQALNRSSAPNGSIAEFNPFKAEQTALKGQELAIAPAVQAPVVEVNMEKSEDVIQLDTVYGEKRFKGYVAIDVLLAPELAGRSFGGNNSMLSSYVNRRDSAEKISFSYSALMRINLFISRNIFINTGIQFSQRREKFSIGYKSQTNEQYIDSSKFVTYIDPFTGPVIYKTYDTLNYVRTIKDSMQHNLLMKWVDIPVMIGYKWLGRRSALSIQAGVMFNLLFTQKGNVAPLYYVPGDAQASGETLFNRTAGMSICGGFSASRKLTDKLDLLIEPHTRFILNPITAPAFPIQQKIFTYGINVGVRYKL